MDRKRDLIEHAKAFDAFSASFRSFETLSFHRTWRPALDDAARHLGLVVTEPYIVSKTEDFEPIFANMRQDRSDGLLALPRASFFRTVTAASRPVNAHAAAENVSRVPV